MAQTHRRILIYFSLILICVAALTFLAYTFSKNIWLSVSAAMVLGFILAFATSGMPIKGDDYAAQLDALRKGELSAGGDTGKYLHQVLDDACATLDAIASGDLSIAPRGDYSGDYQRLKTSLGNALATMNDSMADINSSLGSAYTYSKCLSESSLQLAENSVDQVVSISNLGQSMALVAERAIHTTTLARSIVDSGEHVKRLAMAGTRQLDSVAQAVQDINGAGKSIEQVVRILDDIAFRTNILALNTTTEATRAGQNNNGFAIVANEVRQLAGISANAAQQSKQVIFNTISKADEGYGLSMQMRSSLEQVLTGIQDITASIEMIGRGSDTQAREINTVNTLLEEQAQAVNKSSETSDTAAEYGRALEQCAGQLGQLAQRFILDEAHSRRVRESRKQLVAIRPTGQGSGESMYKQLVWDDSLRMGNDIIDGQHKQLIEMVDRLLASCFNGTASSEINKAMSFLLDYTVRHFADEEKLQIKCGYPEYRRHKQLHNAFKQKAVSLARMLEQNGPTTEMIGIINRELVDWLLNHIKIEDKKISRYLRG